MGIDLGQEPVPDETTVCKFRHLLEEHELGGAMLETVNVHLQAKGVRITHGDDRGRDDHPCAEFDQEPRARSAIRRCIRRRRASSGTSG